MEFCMIWRNGLELEIVAYTNVWMKISHCFGGPKQYLWTQFRSLPLVRGLSFQKQILMYCIFDTLFLFTKSYCRPGCFLWTN